MDKGSGGRFPFRKNKFIYRHGGGLHGGADDNNDSLILPLLHQVRTFTLFLLKVLNKNMVIF